ncbi:MAG: 3-methyl-2-oxobutanoate hydroxymethyltransferase [Microthrixaceae bacterium]
MSVSDTSPRRKVTVPAVAATKRRRGDDVLVMVTAYDTPTARMGDGGGADILLVGDSLAMVALGYDDTLQVTVGDMAHHVAAVARSRPSALIVGDLPWLSYHVSRPESVRNAAELVKAGAQAVKLEGGAKRVPMIESIVDAEIPVMGHIGLTPQSIHAMGGFKVQGRESPAAMRLVTDAKALQHAGCFAVVIEGVPSEVAAMVTDAIDVPTIGIGAGPRCDGQVLVLNDLLGVEDRLAPKFVRRYANLGTEAVEAISRFAADVRGGSFPGPEESYHLDAAQAEALALYGAPERG